MKLHPQLAPRGVFRRACSAWQAGGDKEQNIDRRSRFHQTRFDIILSPAEKKKRYLHR
jgi:hypothetical protein